MPLFTDFICHINTIKYCIHNIVVTYHSTIQRDIPSIIGALIYTNEIKEFMLTAKTIIILTII